MMSIRNVTFFLCLQSLAMYKPHTSSKKKSYLVTQHVRNAGWTRFLKSLKFSQSCPIPYAIPGPTRCIRNFAISRVSLFIRALH